MPFLKERYPKIFKNVELLFLFTVVSVLALIVFIVVNPVQRAQDSSNAHRLEDINSILLAVKEYSLNNNGELPESLNLGMSVAQIGTSNSSCDIECTQATASACINLNSSLAKYLKSMPTDFENGTQEETRYHIVVSGENTVTVGVCNTEITQSLSVF